MNPPPPDNRHRDSMLDLPLRSGDGQVELPFGTDQMRGPQARPPASPPPRRPRRRAKGGRKRALWIAVALLGALLLAYLMLWPKPPEPSFSADPFVLSKVRVGGGGELETVTVTNVGERPMVISMVRLIDGDVDEFLLAEDQCGAQTLDPMASCSVKIGLRPTRMGTLKTFLELQADMPDNPARLTVSGEGTAPVMAIDPATTNFGPQDVGTSSEPFDLVVSNQGTAPLQIRRVALGGVAERDYRLTRNDCSKATLDPGQTCALRLVFMPRASGTRQAAVILDSDGLEPVPTADLMGEGIWTGAAFAVEPQAVDFGRRLVGTPGQRQRIQVVNRQGNSLRGIRVRLAEPANGFSLASETCGGKTLGPGEGCQIEVGFAPAQDGDFDSLLEISHPDVGTLGIGLSGRGVAPLWIAGAAALDFGALGIQESGAAQALELRNEGTAAAAVEQVELAGDDGVGFQIADDGCSGRQIDPDAGCRVQVRFEPQREGEHRAGLRFRVEAGSEPQVVTLMGRAVAPRLSLDREMVSFDRVHRTTQSQAEIRLANRGTAALQLGPFDIVDDADGQYRILGGSCLGQETLPPAQGCVLVVGFSPMIEGRSTARLEIEHDGISGPREVPLAGIGLPPPIPKLVLEPATIDFGPQPIGNRSSIQTIDVRAGGTGSLVLREFSIEGEHATDFVIVPATCHAGPSLLPGTACAIGVRFVPSMAGRRSARLVLRHNAGGGVDRIELLGEGMGGPPG